MKNQCSKVRFVNEQMAQFYIDKLQATSTRTKVPKSAYLCPNCLCWHLTSAENKDEIVECKEEIKRLKTLLEQRENEIKNKIKHIKKFQRMLYERTKKT